MMDRWEIEAAAVNSGLKPATVALATNIEQRQSGSRELVVGLVRALSNEDLVPVEGLPTKAGKSAALRSAEA